MHASTGTCGQVENLFPHSYKNDACSGFVNESPSMYVVGQNTTLTLPLLILDVIKISNIQLMRLFAI